MWLRPPTWTQLAKPTEPIGVTQTLWFELRESMHAFKQHIKARWNTLKWMHKLGSYALITDKHGNFEWHWWYLKGDSRTIRWLATFSYLTNDYTGIIKSIINCDFLQRTNLLCIRWHERHHQPATRKVATSPFDQWLALSKRLHLSRFQTWFGRW